jgi:hypothetical protein
VSLFRYNPEIHDNPEFHGRRHGYDPNQPRVPAGRDDGGQWTRGGRGSAPPTRLAALQSDRVADDGAGRDAPEEASRNQLAFLRESSEAAPAAAPTRPDAASPRTPATGPAQHPSGPVRAGAWLTIVPGIIEALPDPDDQVVYEYQLKAKEDSGRKILPDERFRSKEYPQDKIDKTKFDISRVRALTREEAGKFCERLKDVQRFVDKAVGDSDLQSWDLRASEFGTKVHTLVARQIEGENDRNFKFEVSYFKVVNQREAADERKWGEKGTVRLDALEYVPDQKRVCVYEIKTGNAQWYYRRMDKLAEIVHREYPHAESFVLMQVKPTDPGYQRRQ